MTDGSGTRDATQYSIGSSEYRRPNVARRAIHDKISRFVQVRLERDRIGRHAADIELRVGIEDRDAGARETRVMIGQSALALPFSSGNDLDFIVHAAAAPARIGSSVRVTVGDGVALAGFCFSS